MTVPSEIADLFWSDPTAPRLMGYGSDTSIVAGSPEEAVAVCAQLLRRSDKRPSGTALWLQLQPADALALATAILQHAMDKGWPIAPDFLEHVERIRLSPDTKRH